MILFVVYYSSSNVTSAGFQGVLIINYTKATIHIYKKDALTSFEDEEWQSITSNLEPGNKVKIVVVFGEGFVVDRTTLSLLYDEPVNKEMKCCHVVDEEDVIVSGNDDSHVGVSDGYKEVILQFREGAVNHLQITRPTDRWHADVVGLVDLVLHDLDQPAEAVANEICADEAENGQKQQVSLPEDQPELQAAATPETIGMVLGAQILDALKELGADFVRLEQTVTARLNAVEVKLGELEDVIAQIPHASSFKSTYMLMFLSMLLFLLLFCWFVFL